MRPVPLLLASLLLTLGACERRNPQYCDETVPELSCAPGKRCDSETHRCVGGPDMGPESSCQDSSACSAPGAPICDDRTHLCRQCFQGEDSLCAQRDPGTPRCQAPRCVQCLQVGADSREVPECTDAAAQKPVCDRDSSSCRACRLHRECSSGVCLKDAGTCVPVDRVLIVDASLCSNTGPVYCTPKQALDQLDPMRRYVLIRQSGPAKDFSNIEINAANVGMSRVYVIGPMADGPPEVLDKLPPVKIGGIDMARGFVIDKNSKVTLEGLYITGSSIGVQCYGDGVADDVTEVRILRSVFTGNMTGVSLHDNCQLLLQESWFGPGTVGTAFAADAGNQLALDVARASFDIVNTVFTGNGDEALGKFGGIQIDNLAVGVRGSAPATVVNSLFYDHRGVPVPNGYSTISCGGTMVSRLLILNTTFLQHPNYRMSLSEYIEPSCGKQFFHLATDDDRLVSQMGVLLKRKTNDWKTGDFRRLQGRDFHLLAGASPPLRTGGAANAGTPPVMAPDRDLDGRPRPRDQGHVAIGPHEPDRAP